MKKEELDILIDVMKNIISENIQEQFNLIREEMNNFREEIKSEIIPRIDNLEKSQKELKEDIQKLRNSMFVFEHEYGRKIDALYDWREIEIEKDKQEALEKEVINKRLDNFDIISWQHEKRISSLEKNCQN